MQLKSDNTVKDFLNYLLAQGKSPISVKNYKSDISHFLAWATLKLKAFGTHAENFLELTPFIDSQFFVDYKNYMLENKIKNKTINRRLSSLRNLSVYLFDKQIFEKDFMQGIQNVGIGLESNLRLLDTEIVQKFKESLLREKVSDNTIKNYLSDVRGFLNWYIKKGELPNET